MPEQLHLDVAFAVMSLLLDHRPVYMVQSTLQCSCCQNYSASVILISVLVYSELPPKLLLQCQNYRVIVVRTTRTLLLQSELQCHCCQNYSVIAVRITPTLLFGSQNNSVIVVRITPTLLFGSQNNIDIVVRITVLSFSEFQCCCCRNYSAAVVGLESVLLSGVAVPHDRCCVYR